MVIKPIFIYKHINFLDSNEMINLEGMVNTSSDSYRDPCFGHIIHKT